MGGSDAGWDKEGLHEGNSKATGGSKGVECVLVRGKPGEVGSCDE